MGLIKLVQTLHNKINRVDQTLNGIALKLNQCNEDISGRFDKFGEDISARFENLSCDISSRYLLHSSKESQGSIQSSSEYQLLKENKNEKIKSKVSLENAKPNLQTKLNEHHEVTR